MNQFVADKKKDYETRMTNMYQMINATAGLNQNCVAKRAEKCLFAVYAIEFIRTPMFIINSKFDASMADGQLCALCSVRCELCAVLCSLHSASLLSALCSLLSALRTLPLCTLPLCTLLMRGMQVRISGTSRIKIRARSTGSIIRP